MPEILSPEDMFGPECPECGCYGDEHEDGCEYGAEEDDRYLDEPDYTNDDAPAGWGEVDGW